MLGDSHIHMILDGVYYRAAIDAQKACPDEALIHSRLAAYREAGILFLRDGGDAWGVALRAAQLAPEYGIEYLTPAFPIHRNGRYGGFIGKGFEDMRQYRARVNEAKAMGADFIKIMISGLMDFNTYGQITSSPLSAQEIREMIHIAHEEGFSVMAHANGSETVIAAAEAGVDSVEHGAYLNDEAVHALAESGAVWTPTLVTVHNLIGDGRYPDSVLIPLEEYQLRQIALCVSIGGKIALGSDNGAYNVPHVQGTFDEMNCLKPALGENIQAVLEAGEAEIRRRFRRRSK